MIPSVATRGRPHWSGAESTMRTPRTSFVGRASEVRRVVELLGVARILTLVGPGGIGKSRLALEASRVVSAERAIADIGSLDRGARVGVRVAELYGIGEPEDGSPIAHAVAGALPTDALLVLDGCEHVIDDVASFADALLDRAPALRILATSQRPLGLAGEVTWAVPAMSDADATALFAARAASADPERAFGPAEAAAIADLCRGLDGLPLAIELAAARTRSMTVGEIAAGMGRRFELLGNGVRAADPRHATLRASLDWSYDLLTDRQREILQRLSLFVSGFDASSAAAVADGSTLEELAGLVERSLVSFDPHAPSGWYRLSDTTRAYALDKLEASGDAPAARVRFLRHFRDLVEQTVPLLDGPEQASWMSRLLLDQDNISAALAWSAAAGDDETLARIAGAMGTVWLESSQWSECRVWLERSVEAPGLDPLVRARLLERLCHLGTWTGDFDAVVSRAGELLETAGAAGDKWYIGRALGYRAAGTALAVGAEAARNDFTRVRRLSLEGADAWGYANLAWAFCVARMFQSDPDEPRRLLDEAMALAARAGDSRTARLSSALAALLAVTTGRLDDARRLGWQTYQDARQSDHWSAALLAVSADAWQRVLRGAPEEAAALAVEAIALAEASNEDSLFRMLGLTVLGLAYDALLEIDEAEEALTRAVAAARVSRLGRWVALPLVFRGVLFDDEAALAEATDIAKEHHLTWIHAYALLARARRLRGVDDAAAEGFAYDALSRHLEAGNVIGMCDALDEVALHRRRRGAAEAARRLRGAAAAQRDRLGVASAGLAGLVGGERGEPADDAAFDEIVRAALRARGPHVAAVHGWESLTPAELQVARLIGGHLTNPQIAERLYVSLATVKTHLGHIFAKLQIGTRSELAVLVRAHEGNVERPRSP
jgi:predicted ATPase/DNA-binding CsgD family transcriptional regulator